MHFWVLFKVYFNYNFLYLTEIQLKCFFCEHRTYFIILYVIKRDIDITYLIIHLKICVHMMFKKSIYLLKSFVISTFYIEHKGKTTFPLRNNSMNVTQILIKVHSLYFSMGNLNTRKTTTTTTSHIFFNHFFVLFCIFIFFLWSWIVFPSVKTFNCKLTFLYEWKWKSLC